MEPAEIDEVGAYCEVQKRIFYVSHQTISQLRKKRKKYA